MEQYETGHGVSRRNFLKGGIAAMALAGGASLLSEVPAALAKTPENASGEAGASTFPMSIDKDAYFATPAAITNFSSTEDVDVVVIGAGAAGVSAACSAAENGAKVAVLQKSPRVYSHGIIFAGFNAPSIIAEKGELSADEINSLKAEFLELTHYGAQTTLLNKFFEECPEAIEWQIKRGTDLGFKHMFFGSAHVVAWPVQSSQLYAGFAKYYEENYDCKFHYSTPAVQLITDASGAVTGAIGQDRDGNYLQFNASKGVVIATGGYGGNKELLARWCPDALSFPNGCYPEDNTGDGDLMAIWAGADISPYPHSKKIDIRFYGTSPARTDIEKIQFLLVNDQGHRMGKEDATEMQQYNEMLKEPSKEGTYYCIFDKNYGTWLTGIGQDRAVLSDAQVKEYESLTPPILYQADTLDELASKIGVDADNLAATVKRNNELAAAGVDSDYYKDSKNLYKIDAAPYYAMVRQYTVGGILGGLKVDDTCNVISRKGEAIKGLYAVGNDMGGLQRGQEYVWHDYGFTLGCAATFGYMVGRDLAKA